MNWNEIAQIAPGGTILEIATTQAGEQLLVSPNGLFKQEGDDWRLLKRGVPFWQTNSATVAGKTIFISGLPTGIIRSFDGGQSWLKTFIDQQTAPIVKIVPSPSYAKDRVMLAATFGDGILRSTDGGRHWQLSNFGLRDFGIIDLVAAPSWNERYEFLLAVSETAVYHSPNGGRAWRRGVFDDEMRPSVVAFSPNFEEDQTAYVGSDLGHLYLSEDGGQLWQKVASGFNVISSMIVSDKDIFLGGLNQIIKCPRTDLSKQEVVYQKEPSFVLSLTKVDEKMFASFEDEVTFSADNGRSWKPLNGINARRFVWIKTTLNEVIAAGPEDGVWLSKDGGKSWKLIFLEGTTLAIDVIEQDILVSSDTGLFRSADLGETWLQDGSIDDQIMGVAIDGSTSWYGNHLGIIRRKDEKQLKQIDSPFAGCQLLDMQMVNRLVTMAVFHEENGELQLWQWHSSSASWHLEFSERAQPNKPILSFDNLSGLAVAVSGNLYLKAESGWRWVKISDSDSPITAVTVQKEFFLIAATDQLYKLSKNDLSQIEEIEWAGDPILHLDNKRLITINGRVYEMSNEKEN